jgi:hypothetical protein
VYKLSLRLRVLEWVLWRIRAKSRFEKMDGFRKRTIKSRPSNPRPPRSIYRRYNVVENTQHGKQMFSISRKNGESKNIYSIFTAGPTPIRLWECSRI